MAVKQILSVTPSLQPSQVARNLEQRFNYHPLYRTSKGIYRMIDGQTVNFVRREKEKYSPKEMESVKRVKYAGDVWEYIQMHCIRYDKLDEIQWKPQLRFGPEWIRAMSVELKAKGVLSGIGFYSSLPDRDLVVLDSDEVERDTHWQFLVKSKESTHTTGPDPRRRTVVFTSMALLGNAVWCERMNWEVGACCDGTHGMSKSEYKLITLGIYGFSTETGSRTFHPLVYGFGEGEREIVALHVFLNLKIALRELFGIGDFSFKWGVVSDAAAVFVNSIAHAFPGTPHLQCYPHIIRKFKVHDRKGNGSYIKHLSANKSKAWMSEEAESAVRRCSLCKTKAQKDMMWKLTERKWIEEGESGMAQTFGKQYINDPHYAKWWYAASGQHGCVPCNNPMENHNLFIKGTPDFFGYVEIGRDMRMTLTQEFVKLIYQVSTDLSYPKNDLPLLNFEKAYRNDLFMEFRELFNPAIDMVEYGGGWLLNDISHLSEDITDEDIYKMELALEGIIDDDATSPVVDPREELLNHTMRFHFVVVGTWREGPDMPDRKYYKCDCRDFYFHRWCFQSALLQHRDKLELLGEPIKKKSSGKAKHSKTKQIAFALFKARKRMEKKTAEQKALVSTTQNIVGSAVLTQDEDA
jgi:hypothetical protein